MLKSARLIAYLLSFLRKDNIVWHVRNGGRPMVHRPEQAMELACGWFSHVFVYAHLGAHEHNAPVVSILCCNQALVLC